MNNITLSTSLSDTTTLLTITRLQSWNSAY